MFLSFGVSLKLAKLMSDDHDYSHGKGDGNCFGKMKSYLLTHVNHENDSA